MTKFWRIRAAAAVACALVVGSPASAGPLLDLQRLPILTGEVEYLYDPGFGEAMAIGVLSLFTDTGGDASVIDASLEISTVFDPGTPGDNPLGDLFVTGVGVFGFDPDQPFLTSFTLLRFEVAATHMAFLFGDLQNQAAGLFGAQALVIFSNLGQPIDPEFGGEGFADVSLSAVVPLPLGGLLLVTGLAGLATVGRRRAAGLAA